jgi:hypothetical protein
MNITGIAQRPLTNRFQKGPIVQPPQCSRTSGTRFAGNDDEDKTTKGSDEISKAEGEGNKKPSLDNPREVKKSALELLEPAKQSQAERDFRRHVITSSKDALREGVIWAMHGLTYDKKPELIFKLLDFNNEHVNKGLSDSVYFAPEFKKELLILDLSMKLTDADLAKPKGQFASQQEEDAFKAEVRRILALTKRDKLKTRDQFLEKLDKNKVCTVESQLEPVLALQSSQQRLAKFIAETIKKDRRGIDIHNKLMSRYYQGRLGFSEGLALFMHQATPLLNAKGAKQNHNP